MKQETQAPLNIIIADDEQDACLNLQYMLNACAGGRVQISGIAGNTCHAQQLIEKHSPDAVFLDIEMPQENAFQFLDRITPFHFDVVFVTAYDEFAVRAFKLNAVDYILKPVSAAELIDTLRRLADRKQLRQLQQHGDHAYQLLQEQLSGRKPADKIVLRELHDVEIVSFADICFVEAMGSYSRIHFLKSGVMKTKMLSNHIAAYEALLPPELFYRIHKSYLVNCSYIARILKDETARVMLNNGTMLPVSRRRYTDMLRFLKQNNFYAA